MAFICLLCKTDCKLGKILLLEVSEVVKLTLIVFDRAHGALLNHSNLRSFLSECAIELTDIEDVGG